jgi:hypothetical protein
LEGQPRLGKGRNMGESSVVVFGRNGSVRVNMSVACVISKLFGVQT